MDLGLLKPYKLEKNDTANDTVNDAVNKKERLPLQVTSPKSKQLNQNKMNKTKPKTPYLFLNQYGN